MPAALRVSPAIRRAGWGLGVVLVLACAAGRLLLLPAHVSFNPNEGWNAFQAAHALGGGVLYPAPGGLTGDNYPPLSFYVVGGLGRLVGDPIVAGRGVALFSLLAVAAAVFAGVRRLGAPGASPSAAALGALVFLAFNATQFRGYLAMNDPQWLAHALMTAGFVLLIPRRAGEDPGLARAAAAAALMAAGGLVKHNLVALPLAATLWLALHHRRDLLAWLAVGAAAVGAAAALMALAYGPAVFTDLLAGDRRYAVARMGKALLPVLAVTPLVALSTRLLAARRADPRLDLLLLALGLAVPLGVVQRSGEGVNVNAHFEALIVACMAGAAALQLPGRPLRGPWRLAAWALLLPFVVLLPLTARAERLEFAGEAAAARAWEDMRARIAAAPGPAACETLALCYWAGKDFELDVFLYGQHVTRTRDASALLRALDAHRFAAVELDAPHAPRLGDVADPVPALVAARTRLVFRAADGRRLYAPAP